MTTILIVEDHHITRETYARWLQASGYHVLTAAGSASALHLAQTQPVDLIIGGEYTLLLEGLEAIQPLKTLLPGTPLILISTFILTDVASFLRAKRLASAIFSNHVERALLLEKIADLTGRPDLPTFPAGQVFDMPSPPVPPS